MAATKRKAELRKLPKKLEFNNRATGEIEPWDLSTPQQIAAAHRYATEMDKALKEFRKELRPWDEALVAAGDGKRYDFGDGYEIVHDTSQVFEVPADEVLRHIDMEIVKPALKVTKGKLEAIIADLVRDGAIDSEATTAIKKSYKPIRANDKFVVRKSAVGGQGA